MGSRVQGSGHLAARRLERLRRHGAPTQPGVWAGGAAYLVMAYCGWRKSCTTLSPQSPRNYSSLGPQGGARFHPSTVSRIKSWCVGLFFTSSNPPYASLKPLTLNPQRVHVAIWYILRAQRGSHIPTLRAKYIPYSYMDPLGPLNPKPKMSSTMAIWRRRLGST